MDFSTPIATVSGLTYATAPLPAGSDARFAVRAFDTVSGLEEQNTDAAVRIVTDGAGLDVTATPAAPALLAATPRAGGTVRVEWTWVGAGARPVGFHIYMGTGGVVDYGTVAATVAYAGPGRHYADIAALAGGTAYTFAVRAYNATAEEAGTRTATATAVTAPPANVESLAAAATGAEG